MMGIRVKLGVMLTMIAAAAAVWAFPEVPKASGRALKVTRGKPFNSGLVFVNGKFITPPYVVERWGNGIRINKTFVTGQVIDWSEFLKTQAGFKMTKSEEPAPAPAPAVETPAPAPEPAPEPEPEVDEDDDSSLDDLFDDDPKPKKKKKVVAKKPVVKPVRPAAPPKPKVTTTYSIEGDFVPNDATKAMVGRINGVRTEIDRILRAGGFICFGDGYSRVTGDARTANEMLEVLPEIMQHGTSAEGFVSSVRQKQLYYLTEPVCQDIFRNRVDYRALQELRSRRKKEQEFNDMIRDVSGSKL